MPLSLRKRKQTTIEFSATNRVSENLSRGMTYRELYLRLQGQPTVSIANNTAAKTLAGDEWACISKIELIANGTDVIKSISGNALWWLNYFTYGKAPAKTPTLGDGATANPSFDSVLILPLWLPDGVNPMDTALRSDNLSSLELAITWGDYTSINASASGWTTDPTLQVFSAEVFGQAAQANFANWRVFGIEKEITATNSQFQVDLPIGNMYRGFLINTTDAGVDAADILNNVKLLSGTTVFHDIQVASGVLPQIERIRRGLEYSTSLRMGDGNDIGGWYWLDHVEDGLLTESIDTLGLSEFKMECDVTVGAGTTKLRVYPMQIIPVRGASK